jgi:glyoxalase/bleomycin resistance protein/dioxygenase superfamily protein
VEDAEEPQARHVQLLLPDPSVHARLVPGGRPIATLDGLLLADAAERWEALGLDVGPDRTADVGGVRLAFGCEGERGIVGWRVRGLAGGSIDGLVTETSTIESAPGTPTHPLGAIAVDHVVVSTPDLDRTLGALQEAGLDLRRVREAGPDARQGFFNLGTAVLEVVGPRKGAPHREPPGERVVGDGPASFWGLVLVVDDLDAAAQRLGDLAGTPRDAVQPGRRIATVRREAGLGTAVALMTRRDGSAITP